MVLKLIREFWRTTKVYRNEVVGGYFVGQVLGITMKPSIKTIAQAISCECRGNKFMSSWGNELEDHIGHSF